MTEDIDLQDVIKAQSWEQTLADIAWLRKNTEYWRQSGYFLRRKPRLEHFERSWKRISENRHEPPDGREAAKEKLAVVREILGRG